MSNLRGTYEKLTRYYLREARSCEESRAYRMTIVSAATAVHLGVYSILLVKGKYKQDEKIKDFHEVFEEIKKDDKFKDIINDIEWLKHARNAVSHPDEWIIPEIITNSHKGSVEMKIKEKIKDFPEAKKIVYISSITDNLESLKKLASDAIDKAEKILKRLGLIVEAGSVNGWKAELEKRVSKLLGRPFNLENISHES